MGNMLQYHYDEEHSVRDPGLVTSITHRCGACKCWFAREAQLKNHKCPAKGRMRERMEMFPGGCMPIREGPALPPPRGWVVATDGSGQVVKEDGNSKKVAGWGVVVFRWPIVSDVPDVVLHAPVITQEWGGLSVSVKCMRA